MPAPESPTAPPRPLSPFVWIAAVLVVGVLLAFGYLSYRQMQASAQLDNFGPAPKFSFTAQDGSTVSSDSLKGKAWTVNFIFTRCAGPCPILTGQLAQVNQELGDGWKDKIQLVSISVDPENDTPAVLKEYGERVGATPDRWKFLNGPEDQVTNVVVKGFLQPLGKDKEGMPMHSGRFVLVDKNGNIRGFQDSSEPDAIPKLVRNLQTLGRE